MTKIYRLLAFIVLIISFFMVSLFIDKTNKNKKNKTKKFVNNASYFANLALKVFNIKVSVKNYTMPEQIHVLASNHLSYIDIIILMAKFKAVFLSTEEVKNTKLFGKLAYYGGAIFIDRNKKTDVNNQSNKIKEILENGYNVAIFFEGTTSDGNTVLPFKSSLFEPIIQTRKPILPICIKYHSINNTLLNDENKDLVFYYGDMKLARHVFEFLTKVKEISVSITILPVLENINMDRKTLAKNLHKDILNCYINNKDDNEKIYEKSI